MSTRFRQIAGRLTAQAGIFWVLFLAILPALSSAQYALRPGYLTTQNGLSSNMINDMVLDRRGFVWIATRSGLNRFDGTVNEMLLYQPHDSTTISDDHVTALFLDRQDQLWVLTRSGGINRKLNGLSRFKRYRKTGSGAASLQQSDSMLSAAELEDGSLWMQSASTLFRYQPAQDEFEPVLMPKPLRMVRMAANGRRLLIKTFSSELYEFDPDTGSLTLLPASQNHSLGLFFEIRNAASTRYAVKDSLSLFVFDRISHRLDTVFAFSSPVNQFDVQGEELLVTLKNRAVYSLDLSTLVLKAVWSERAGSGPTAYSDIEHLLRVDPATILLGTYLDGLQRLDDNERFIRVFDRDGPPGRRLFNQSVRSLLPLSNGRFLAGGYSGLELADIFTGSRTVYAVEKSTTGYVLGVPYALAVHPLQPELVLIGTEGNGLHQLHVPSGRLSRIPEAPGVHPFIRNLVAFGGGLLLVNRYHTLEVLRLPGAATDMALTARLSHLRRVELAVSDRSGGIWIAEEGGNVHLFDERLNLVETVRIFDRSATITQSCNDLLRTRSGDLYAATNRGLYHRLPDGTVRWYNRTHGLPNPVIYELQEDAGGTLWMSTDFGLARFLPESGSFLAFTEPDELQASEFNRFASAALGDSALLFGGVHGINLIYPRRIESSSPNTDVLITAVVTNRRAFEPAAESDPVYRLRYDENQLSIRFSSPHYSPFDRNRFYYRLLPVSETWLPVQSGQQVDLQQLRDGSYRFEVARSLGVPAPDALRAGLSFQIQPAFYATWWFATLLAAFIIMSAAYYYYTKIRMLRHETALQKTYTQKLIVLQEDERKRIADALHDSVGNQLTLIRLKLHQIRTTALPDQMIRAGEESAELLQAAIREVRAISHDLHPHLLQRIGLSVSIRALLEQIRQVAPMQLNVFIDNVDGLIPPDRGLILYRFVQESLTNMLKYSMATSVDISLTAGDGVVRYRIADDGRGFDKDELERATAGMAFHSFRERAAMINGRLDIRSQPGEQTVITLEISV